MKHPTSIRDQETSSELKTDVTYRFELSVEGMSCIKCKGKVENIINEMNMNITNVKIDFITNRILLSIPNRDAIEDVSKRIEGAGFKVKEYKDISHTLLSSNRTITLKVSKESRATITSALNAQYDMKANNIQAVFMGDKCLITYNPIFVRGNEIISTLKALPEYKDGSLTFTIDNIFEDDVKQIKFSDFSLKQVMICLIINILNIASTFLPEDLKYVPARFGMFSYFYVYVLILAFLNFYYVSYDIYVTSFKQLLASMNINMLTLVSIGSGLAFIFGIIYTLIGLYHFLFLDATKECCFYIMSGCHMFHTSATIILALVAGKYIEGKIKKKIYGKIDDLKTKLQVKMNNVEKITLKNKKFDILASEDLHPLLIEKDDYIMIKNACMIPFDGFVEKGTLKVVENVQYGWEKVEVKTKGQFIMSGSQIIEVNKEENEQIEGAIIRVTEPLEKTMAGRLFYEIKEATSGGSANGKSADTLALVTKYFITIVIIISIITLFGWIAAAAIKNGGIKGISYAYAFEKAIAVLVASCPCALGIAIPMMYAIAMRKGLKAGFLIKDVENLDVLGTIDTVVFDKTGTITGTYNIKSIQNLSNNYKESLLWEIVSLLEKNHLQHPVGLLLFQEAAQRISEIEDENLDVKETEFKQDSIKYYSSEGIVHKGMKIANKNVEIALGNDKLLQRLNISSPKNSDGSVAINISGSDGETQDEVNLNQDKMSNETTIYLCIDNQIQLSIRLSLVEDVKSNALQLISFLKRNNLDVHILSGDSKSNVIKLGQQIGIPKSNIHAEVDPEHKEKYIFHLTKECNKKVLMIGDGLNDIKAFKAATLSCSINFKSSQNLTHSNFIIVNNSLSTISSLFTLAFVSKKFKDAILACAIIYNVPTILASSGALKVLMGIDLAAYMACWTMVAFSLILTFVANLMELVDIKKEGSEIIGLFTIFKGLLFNKIKRTKSGKKTYVDLQ